MTPKRLGKGRPLERGQPRESTPGGKTRKFSGRDINRGTKRMPKEVNSEWTLNEGQRHSCAKESKKKEVKRMSASEKRKIGKRPHQDEQKKAHALKCPEKQGR